MAIVPSCFQPNVLAGALICRFAPVRRGLGVARCRCSSIQRAPSVSPASLLARWPDPGAEPDNWQGHMAATSVCSKFNPGK